jgi:hypothetical protein
MAYMLLITEPGDNRRQRAGRDAWEQMLRFRDGLDERGLLIAGEALRSDAEGVRMQVRGGKRSVIDGPFSESREIVGGFFLLDCDSLQEAMAIAGECPAIEWATLEVRETGRCYDE